MKTWTLIYRHHDRKRRLTLGRFPDLGLADARRRAIEERGRIVGGSDPVAEKHDERATQAIEDDDVGGDDEEVVGEARVCLVETMEEALCNQQRQDLRLPRKLYTGLNHRA